jgi:hypothetical protein
LSPPRRQALLVLALLSTLLTLAAAPASAAAPVREEIDSFIIILDPEHELVVFWNISRDDFCAWEASNFEGPAPVQQLIPAKFIETGKGAVVMHGAGVSTLELWALDEGADLSGPCQDTDAQTGPWAVGTAHWTRNDNDLDVSGTRTNAFGERLQSTVVDPAGNTRHFSGHFRAVFDRDGEFRVVSEQFTLSGQ